MKIMLKVKGCQDMEVLELSKCHFGDCGNPHEKLKVYGPDRERDLKVNTIWRNLKLGTRVLVVKLEDVYTVRKKTIKKSRVYVKHLEGKCVGDKFNYSKEIFLNNYEVEEK